MALHAQRASQLSGAKGVAQTLFMHWNATMAVEGGKPTAVVAIASTLAAGALSGFFSAAGFLGEDCGRLVAARLLNALATCHSRGVYHRDIKPDVRVRRPRVAACPRSRRHLRRTCWWRLAPLTWH